MFFCLMVCLATAACLSGAGAHAELSRPARSPPVGPLEGLTRHLRVHEPAHDNEEERGGAETVANTISTHASEGMNVLGNELLPSITSKEWASRIELLKDDLLAEPSTGVQPKLHEGIGKDEVTSIVGLYKWELSLYKELPDSPPTLLQLLTTDYGNKGVDQIIEIMIKEEDAVSKAVTGATELKPVELSMEDVANLREGMGNQARTTLRYWMQCVRAYNKNHTNSQTTLVDLLKTKFEDDKVAKIIEIALEDETTVLTSVKSASKLQPNTKHMKTSQKAKRSPKAKPSRGVTMKAFDEIDKNIKSILRNLNDFNDKNDAKRHIKLLKFFEARYNLKELAKIFAEWKRDTVFTIPLPYSLELLHDRVTPKQLFFAIQQNEDVNFFALDKKVSVWINYVQDFNKEFPEKAEPLLDWLGYNKKETANKLFGAMKYPRMSKSLGMVLDMLTEYWMLHQKKPADLFDILGVSEELGKHEGFDSQRFVEWWDYVDKLNKYTPEEASPISFLASKCQPDILLGMLEEAGKSSMVKRVFSDFVSHLNKVAADRDLISRATFLNGSFGKIKPRESKTPKKRKFAS